MIQCQFGVLQFLSGKGESFQGAGFGWVIFRGFRVAVVISFGVFHGVFGEHDPGLGGVDDILI
jgi:hypothetical protein